MSNQIQVIGQAERKITSLEVVDQINLFREEDGNRTVLRHDTLLNIIRDEFEEEIGLLKILETPYIHPQNGQSYPMFELTLSQSKQILMRESKFVRKAVISYVEKLEDAIKSSFNLPQTFPQALMLAAKQAEELESQKQQLAIQAPKAEFFDAVADSTDAISMNDVAKVLSIKGYGQNNLFEFLRANSILMFNNKPYQRYIDLKYFKVVEKPYRKGEESHIGFKTLVYQRGVDFIRKAISKTSDIVPA